jgi:hypothetical protein
VPAAAIVSISNEDLRRPMAQLSSEKPALRRAANHDKGPSSMPHTRHEHCMSIVDVLQATGGTCCRQGKLLETVCQLFGRPAS